MSVVVCRSDARWRRAAVGSTAKPRPSGRQRLAIITEHGDGTSCLRLMGFDPSSLAAVKAAPEERLTWIAESRRWLIWSPQDQRLVIERLRLLGFKVVLR